jgi:anti-anti-sigma factor
MKDKTLFNGKLSMNISTRDIENILAIDIEGKLDTSTSVSALDELLQCLEAKPGNVLINLAPLEFISSAGLRVILRVAKHVRGYRGAMKVAGAHGMVKEVLEISGFDSLLDLYESEEQAVGSFI